MSNDDPENQLKSCPFCGTDPASEYPMRLPAETNDYHRGCRADHEWNTRAHLPEDKQ
jgi:hypothetical protein